MEPSPQYSFIECFHYLQGTAALWQFLFPPPLSSRGSALCPVVCLSWTFPVGGIRHRVALSDWLSLSRLIHVCQHFHQFRAFPTPAPRVEMLRGWGGGSLSYRMMLSALVSDRCCWHLKVLPTREREWGDCHYPDAMPNSGSDLGRHRAGWKCQIHT